MFFGPFLINLISTIILIKNKSHQQSTIHPERTYVEHLYEQYRQHKHLLIAPIVLVLLAFPRLIITFVSKCMQSANDSWLFLCGYFIHIYSINVDFCCICITIKILSKRISQSCSKIAQNYDSFLFKLILLNIQML
jgi:hypothetical protein